jgi:hypothetical protein
MNGTPEGYRSCGRIQIVALASITAGFALLVVLNCSGLSFPILNPRGDLDGRFQRDFGVRLPPSAEVDQSARVAYLDSSRAYSLHMAPADAVTFISQLAAAAAGRGYTVEGPAAGTGRLVRPPYHPPDWWHPERWPDATEFHTTTGGTDTSQFVYGAAYSPSTGRVYIYRSEM